MENENSSNMAIWFVGGALLGAVVALLMAPESGEGTRRKLAGQAERGRKSLIESGQELFEKGRELYERGREIAEDAAEMFERGRHIAEKTIDERV
jgi:gas vesicle protein